MNRRAFLSMVTLLAILPAFVSASLAADRVRLGTGVDVPAYNLVMWAGQDHGIWQKNGLGVEWSIMRGSGLALRSLAAGALDMGTIRVESAILGLSQGAPAMIVAEHRDGAFFDLYVKADGSLREPKDLRGRTIVANAQGGAAHISALFLVRTLGLEGQVKYVFVRETPEQVAAVKQGAADALVTGQPEVLDILIEKGEMRRLVSLRDYLPREWVDNVIVANKKFLSSNSALVARMVKAWFEARESFRNNPEWAIKRLMVTSGFDEKTARKITQIYIPKMDKKFSPEGLKNVLDFMIEFGQIKKEGLPPVESFYTLEFAK